MLTETDKSHWDPWNWNYKLLLATKCVQGIESRSFKKEEDYFIMYLWLGLTYMIFKKLFKMLIGEINLFVYGTMKIVYLHI